jgi:glycogen debranching enzyme
VAFGLTIFDGAAFFCSQASGDVDGSQHEGFFLEDVRHLSRWELVVNGRPLDVITSRPIDCFSARILGSIPGDRSVSITRDRFVADGVHEDLVVENWSPEEQRLRLELRLGADFADVFEVQTEGMVRKGRRWSEVGSRSLTLWSERRGYRRGTAITFSRNVALADGRARFDVTLAPRERWQTCVDITPIVERRRRRSLNRCGSFGRPEPKRQQSVDDWYAAAPILETDHDALTHVYRQSLTDLAALRLRPGARLGSALPAGGIPWFMTLFGRDSIIASFQSLPFQPLLAEATLVALAELQATEHDHFADAEPGKVLHELRRGSLAGTGEIPDAYYGAHDSTPLFLILLDEYERWTGDERLVRRLEPAARAALAWIEGPADLDGDGYLEYQRRSSSPTALPNHCWKDSGDSIVFADGSRADPPIATCEVQGYAYDARMRLARLARAVYGDDELAERLEAHAQELKERFNRDFWHSERRHYVLALDGEKRQVDSMTSNTGHLLWSGIVDERRARSVARRLLGDDLFTGWGLRTLSAADRGYDPLSYHRGTVWPHDTAIAAEGLRRYGFRVEAAKLSWGLIEAAEGFGHRLPEVFAGFPRDGTDVPIQYPDALSPQAWAAGAPLLVLRTLLGLDVVDGKLRASPHPARALGTLKLRGIPVRGRRVDAG